ncbi:hypothetical protein [Virgibacillus halodenitrificans]|uniref:hypothetical protein n=1 Tax=Virgibacillus halodenitrificans TaxID=1482 RepID=UPI000EF488CB|nr:hypothetical protein [Virgibacillus halodenitrificans]
MDYQKNELYKKELVEGLRHAGISNATAHESIDVLEGLYVDEVGKVSFNQLQKYYGINGTLDIIEEPLTIDEIISRKDEQNIITGILPISVETLISLDGDEGFLDYVCKNFVDGRMYDVVYSLIEREGDIIYLEITGDVTPLMEDKEIVAEP